MTGSKKRLPANTVAINLFWVYIICVIGLGTIIPDFKKGLLANTVATEQLDIYIGTNTNHPDQGIYSSCFNIETGQLTSPTLAAKALNPNFIAFHPNGKFLYTVGRSKSLPPKTSGCVNAFSICPQTAKLSLINQAPSSGQTPCHITMDKTGKYAFISNYSTGNLNVLPVNANGHLSKTSTTIQHTGSSIDPSRQRGPHIHSINLAPKNNFAFAADLGLDKIMIYRFNRDTGTLEPADQPYISLKPGSGPRHFTFHPTSPHAYVINEMANTITAFNYNPCKGSLSETQTISTIPDDYTAKTYTSEIQVHPSGKYLYGSNRGHNSIAVFKIDSDKGTLTLVEIKPSGGKWPRHFSIDPTGNWMLVANERSNQIVVFGIDKNTGKLTQTDNTIDVISPVCIKFAPANPHSQSPTEN